MPQTYETGAVALRPTFSKHHTGFPPAEKRMLPFIRCFFDPKQVIFTRATGLGIVV
jgi:hypothetical protein